MNILKRVLFVAALAVPGSVCAFLILGTIVMCLPARYDKYMPGFVLTAREDAKQHLASAGRIFCVNPAIQYIEEDS